MNALNVNDGNDKYLPQDAHMLSSTAKVEIPIHRRKKMRDARKNRFDASFECSIAQVNLLCPDNIFTWFQ